MVHVSKLICGGGVLFLLLVICNLLQQFRYWMMVGSNMSIPSWNA